MVRLVCFVPSPLPPFYLFPIFSLFLPLLPPSCPSLFPPHFLAHSLSFPLFLLSSLLLGPPTPPSSFKSPPRLFLGSSLPLLFFSPTCYHFHMVVSFSGCNNLLFRRNCKQTRTLAHASERGRRERETPGKGSPADLSPPRATRGFTVTLRKGTCLMQQKEYTLLLS